MNEHEKRARDVVERVILVQKVFGSEDGQKLLHDFLKSFIIFHLPFQKTLTRPLSKKESVTY